ncbi:MAG: two-component regulator propeller domain-containing protein [Pedobacter sp.]|uniref:two-component regulator propeller domain-containing protein n=1 Tax=Pedobacter sp. TaxID=1411316 RepID=UPI002807ED2B|nr:two-component regulator propeller domain-containing protein [Pedobacter sp.]MDQ8005871.1 two-component regulator propeller domain-containing protein [Pedobacter sp.]
MKFSFIKVLLFFLFLFSSIGIYAQSPKINFKNYSINEGLSQNTVLCLLQDKYGFIWIGTEDGLNKFDGYEFTIYKHDNADSTSISHNQINALYEDTDGKIWVATSKGLNVFDREKETFTKVIYADDKSDGSNYIISIYKDKRGDFWIGSLLDLKQYRPKDKKINSYRLSNEKQTELNKVNYIFGDKKGLLWVSIGSDIRRFNPVTKKFMALPALLEENKTLRGSTIRVIKQDNWGRIWIATENNGVFLFNEAKNTLTHLQHQPNNKNSLPINIIREIYIANENEVWFGTRDGLSIYHLLSQTFINYRNDIYDTQSLSHNSIRAILKDRTGNIWLGTYAGGVNIITPGSSMFSLIKEQIGNKAGLSYRVVSSIINSDNNSLWVGTEGGGLNFIANDNSFYKRYPLLENSTDVSANTVKSLLNDGKNIWIGTFKGLWHLDNNTKKLTGYPVPEKKGVYSLAKTKEGIWMGTNGAGIILRKPDGSYQIFKHDPKNPNSICGNSITKILKDGKDNLWIGTDRGLNYYNGKTFKQYFYNAKDSFSLSSSSILSVFIDSKNGIWIGTKGGGLNFFDEKNGKFYNISTKNGLGNNVVQAIQEDDKGNLWVSSNKGLAKISFDRKKLPLANHNYTIFNYYVEDGLQSNQFLTNASNKNSKGELFFGGINGISYFNPEKIKSNNHKPTVVFTDFLIRNKVVDLKEENSPLTTTINETKEIVLTYDQAFITLKFAALNYTNPNKNQYAYKLEGLTNDDEWHYVGNQRTATYTNLDAGTYVFKVKAANNDGVWNEAPKILKIKVLPPWWKSWWAFVIYSLIIALLLYLYYSYSLRTAKLKNDLVYESLIREKDQELYQRKLNFFTNISHEIKTPLTLILAPLEKLVAFNDGNNKIQNQLMLMKRNGERLTRLINQLLDFRKFESGNMHLQAAEGNIVRFLREVVLAFDSYAQYLEIKLNLETDKKSIRLYFDRDKFEKILYNLLSNALKFTKKGGEIIVKVKEETENGYAVIEIIDNGIGIAAHHVPHIFDQFKHYNEEGVNASGTGIGLAFTKGLVELHHGEIYVSSQEHKENQQGYTCFTIKIPTGKNHLKEHEIIADYKDSENIDGYFEQQSEAKPSVSLESKRELILEKNEGETPVMLLVEDNADVMEFLVSHFQDKFIIHQAVNGKDGIDKALEIMPDIIISDVMMPIMSGTTLCNTLKNDNRTSHIPIILLTARTPIIYKIEGLETGADDYITKPFSINIVETRVWNLLELRQKLRERYKKEVTLQPKNIAITSPDEIFLEKVMNFIEANMTEPTLNVEELGKEVAMSRVTLYRKIKALTSQTTIEFIRSVRLKRAAQLLETQNYNVSEVAYMVGFTDVDYFRKCFKEQFKLTPKEFGNDKK